MLSFLFTTALLTAAATTVTALSSKGIDWSSVAIVENSGIKYKNAAGTAGTLESILAGAGVNTVRQRLWVTSGDYGLSYNLNLAKRAKAAGLKVYLDLFLSSTWTDPGNQATPSQWSGYDIDDLAFAVYNYTKDTMNSFQDAGTPLSIVSIGNEITAGLLWPLGSMNSKQYSNVARMLHSASAGIKDSRISPKPKIMIHLDNGWDFSKQKFFYDTVLGAGGLTAADYDIQGVSYYPFYNSQATLANLKSSLSSMKAKYGKDVMVVETNWPVSCPSPKTAFPSDTSSIPFSAAGQTTWMKDVASAVSAAGGSGVFYWEAAWIGNANLGSSCANNLMFDSTGTALSSLSVFASL